MAHQAFERCCEGLRNESGTGDSEAAWHAIGLNQKNRANATSSSPSHNVPWTFGGGDRVSPVCAITQPGRPAELLLLDRHRRGQFRDWPLRGGSALVWPLAEHPPAVWINRNLAAALALAGNKEEARQSFGELMRAYPDLTAAEVRISAAHGSAP